MLKLILKFGFSFALLFWLLKSGKIDFNLIKLSIEKDSRIFIAILLITLQAIIAAYRFKKIIDTKASKPFHFFDIFKLNLIGMFFSSILPGAVTGDLIKLIYIKKHDAKLSKTFLLTSIFIDRLLGLSGLLFLSGILSLIYFNDITAIAPKLSHIIFVNFFLFLGICLFFIFLFLPRKIQNVFFRILKFIPIIGHKIVQIFMQIFSLKENYKVYLQCFLLSFIIQFISVSTFWFLTSPFYQKDLPLIYAFSFIPIGLITVAIPISPAGLGVGHALFEKLFLFVGINGGANLFNLFFICNLAVNLFGIIPYLKTPKLKNHSLLEEQL